MYVLVTVNFYFPDVPNAGEGLKRLSFKQSWDVDLREYMKKLDQKKPVILCGDLNVAHKETGKYVWVSEIIVYGMSIVYCVVCYIYHKQNCVDLIWFFL